MKYTQTEILSLRFRQATQLRKLSRAELFTRMQLVRTVEPLVQEAFEVSETKILKDQLDDAPHGNPWHVSFHASQFPGDDPMACSRQALYRMLDFPPTTPLSRKLRQTADLGKAFESTLVDAWARAGMLLSSSDPENQTGFELPDARLTGSVDAVLIFNNMPLPVEVKQRKHEVVQKMKLGAGPYPEHVSQIKVQIAFIRLYQKLGIIWPLEEYKLCTHGVIYYGSRDNPDGTTAEFRVDYDEHFFNAGVEKLKRWSAYFDEDVLPEENPGKRSSQFGHPHGWRWSKSPCQWCSFKKTCQLDFREGTTQLSKSIGVERAKAVRPSYDLDAARERVKARWQPQKERV